MQLRSALPIRHALARQFLIKEGYDHAGVDKKRQLEELVAKELGEGFADRIVAHYEYGVDKYDPNPLQFEPDGHDGLLLTADGKEVFSTQTASLKKHASWSSESEEFVLVFARQADGEPLVKPRATILRIAVGKRRGNTFDPDAMLSFALYSMEYNGKVEF
jgi:hypothetical protein